MPLRVLGARGNVRGPSAYFLTHGAETLKSNIRHFFSYFFPRKCSPSATEQKTASVALKAVFALCVAKGYIEEDRELLELMTRLGNFKGDAAIVKGLQRLADSGYWLGLETGGGGEDEDEDIHRSDFPLTVSEVLDDGWVFESFTPSLFIDGRWWGREGLPESEKVVLRLPPEVAKLGVAGMSLSCMELRLRGQCARQSALTPASGDRWVPCLTRRR